MSKGLSTAEANKRLKQNGYNELPSSKPRTVKEIAAGVIKEPMFLLLLSCGGLYMLLGDYREGIVLLSSILIVIFITFYQSRKTERALDALRQLSSPRALVIRDGIEVRIPGRVVVPGDLLVLNEGDRIPADATVIESSNLTIDESLLTGESVPVVKSIQKDSGIDSGRVFSGTLVVQGKGLAEVHTTGIKTQFGLIGTSLQNIKQDETRLQKEMKVLVRNLFLIGGVISVGVVVIFYLTKGNFIQSLLNGLASAMAILPEEFPVVLTVFLALGAWRLSAHKVLTRNPSAIETLGSATVLCSDKTGTITQNKMEVVLMHNGKTLIQKSNFFEERTRVSELITYALLASADNSIDPMEIAIGDAYRTIVPVGNPGHKLVKEYPLSKTLFAMTRVVETGTRGSVLACCKGAPEAVFLLCKLNDSETGNYLKSVHEMAEKGYRVIAVAVTEVQMESIPEKQEGFHFKFLGLIGLADPVRPEVPKAIAECKSAGIKVIMITGDYPATARSIAGQIGMDVNGELLTGDMIKSMDDDELRRRIQNANVFARVVPEQKLRIVRALKANKEIVAMTGDGVNDAPALKAAHIGIAMGNKGTDVAREASSLVLLDDNFASIVAAIRSGRKIFDNLQKAMSYIIAIHIPIIGLTLLPAFFTSIPLLLMPLHIVFMELIIDPVCSIAFESEQEERGIMNRPPRDPDEQFFGRKKILAGAGKGLLLLITVLVICYLTIREGHSEGETRAIAFSSLIIGNIFLIIANLSKTRSFIAVFRERNMALTTILVVALVMLMLVISVPALRQLFSFEFPGYSHFISSLAGASVMLMILEAAKYFYTRKLAKK